MDPNANLEELQNLSRKILRTGYEADKAESDATQELAKLGTELAELCLALDRHLMSGGVLPELWAKKNPQIRRLLSLRQQAKALDRKWGNNEYTDTGEANAFLASVMKE